MNIQRGTYAGVRFSQNTNRQLHHFMSVNKIPNFIRPDQLHTTVLYSRKHLPKYQPIGDISPPIVGIPTGFEVWKASDNSPCLVLRYMCPELERRHAYLMEEHQATYDFPTYLPHITLSYNIEDFNPSQLLNIYEFVDAIIITEEYMKELDLEWTDQEGITLNQS